VDGAGKAALTAVRRAFAIRRRLATTPGRLGLAVAALAAGVLLFGLVAAYAADTRGDAVERVATTEPLLVAAVDLSASLSNAHAIASASFLQGGPEPTQLRVRYRDELVRAGDTVARLARETGTSPGSRSAVQLITAQLPVYAGLIGNARANLRQGYPVGNAYLRRASETLGDDMLRPARTLYASEAGSLTAGYEAGTSAWTLAVVVVAGSALLGLLAATQVFLARATRRIVNVRLAVATAVLLGLMAWVAIAFAAQQRALVRAQHEGSDPVQLLEVTRILALRAQANESVALAARGGGGGEGRRLGDDSGFQTLRKPIGLSRPGPARGSGGLLHQAVLTGHPTPAIDAIYDRYRSYLHAHALVVRRLSRGAFDDAVRLAVGPDGGAATTSAAAAALDDALRAQANVAQARFEDGADGARAAFRGLGLGIPVFTVLCGLLALSGVRERLKEYR
jgi:hypothetical protein